MNLWAGEHQASSLERLLDARRRLRLTAAAGTPRLLLAAGGRGGVGKTTLAVNLAVALQQRGGRVLVVDADPRTGGVGTLCGVDLAKSLGDFLAGRSEPTAVVEPGPAGILCAAAGETPDDDSGAEPQGLNRLLRALPGRGLGPTHLLVDLPDGLGPAVRPWLAAAAEMLLVTTPEPAALTGAYAVVKAASRLNAAARVHLVVNQSTGTEARQVFRRLRSAASRFLGLHVWYGGAVPVDPAVARAVERRVPFILGEPAAPASDAVRQVAHRLHRRPAAGGPAPAAPSAMIGVRQRGAVP